MNRPALAGDEFVRNVHTERRYVASLRRTWFELGFFVGVFSLIGVEVVIYAVWWFNHLH